MMSRRNIYFLSFLAIVLLLTMSAYLQFVAGYEPCPLCILQRICFAILGILFLIGIFTYKNKIISTFINSCLILFSFIGLAIAGRQIWLQHVASTSNTECGASLAYMMKIMPINQVIKKIFQGTAECTERGWEFLGLDLAEWAFVWFILFLAISLLLFFKSKKAN